jgi:hypothetical protein
LLQLCFASATLCFNYALLQVLYTLLQLRLFHKLRYNLSLQIFEKNLLCLPLPHCACHNIEIAAAPFQRTAKTFVCIPEGRPLGCS